MDLEIKSLSFPLPLFAYLEVSWVNRNQTHQIFSSLPFLNHEWKIHTHIYICTIIICFYFSRLVCAFPWVKHFLSLTMRVTSPHASTFTEGCTDNCWFEEECISQFGLSFSLTRTAHKCGVFSQSEGLNGKDFVRIVGSKGRSVVGWSWVVSSHHSEDVDQSSSVLHRGFGVNTHFGLLFRWFYPRKSWELVWCSTDKA